RNGHPGKRVKKRLIKNCANGKKEIAKTSFTQRVGTVSGCGATKFFELAPATLRTTFRPRLELRPPRLLVDLRFVAAKVARRLGGVTQTKARLNRGLCESPRCLGGALRLRPGRPRRLSYSKPAFMRVPCTRRCA